jgi:hypothetical protein
MLTRDLIDEFQRYKAIGEKAIAQVPDEAMNRVLAKDGNSIAMLVRHIHGNFMSRFTDFLKSDGEKPWRERDREFEERQYSRSEVQTLWMQAWETAERELGKLTDSDLEATVTIRGVPFTAHGALCRLAAHAAYHVGQIVLLARVAAEEWHWITIPKGESEQYNQNPTKEKKLG